MRVYGKLLVGENRWPANRYGLDQGLIDFGRGGIVPYNELLEEMLALGRKDDEALGCVENMDHARKIIARGTSAHLQVRVHEQAKADGADEREALRAVVDALIIETMPG